MLLAQLGGAGGYVLPAGPRGAACPGAGHRARGGSARLRAQALHQEAHRWLPAGLAGVGGGLRELRRAHGPRGRRAAPGIAVGTLGRLSEGLLAPDLALAAGNAAWFAFVHDAYGPTAVRLTVQELAAGPGDGAGALDRALRRAAGVGLEPAFREFQVWSALVGRRDDGRHFSFAARIDGPRDSATAEGLPALSVQSDPPVAPLGGHGPRGPR